MWRISVIVEHVSMSAAADDDEIVNAARTRRRRRVVSDEVLHGNWIMDCDAMQ